MIQTYQEAIDFLYQKLPVFQKTGALSLKLGLEGIKNLMQVLDHPHKKFKNIHIGGTNGKGSHAHLIGANLQLLGYKVGMYTSPHLQSFTERISINAQYIPEKYVIFFVNNLKDYIEQQRPTFFEITVAMAFWYFAKEQVDWAIIEVGLGGRLDSTNIIDSKLAMITNIGYDHCEVLGNTLTDIASEKAGIIKSNQLVVIGKKHHETDSVFWKYAQEKRAELYFSQDYYSARWNKKMQIELYNSDNQIIGYPINFPLKVDYQRYNIQSVYMILQLLRQKGYIDFSFDSFKGALEKIDHFWTLKGRWQIIQKQPFIICDVAHNEMAIKEIVKSLKILTYRHLHFILGFSDDKNIDSMLVLLPRVATYYFTKANLPRALSPSILMEKGAKIGLTGNKYLSVQHALEAARENTQTDDCIFISGSFLWWGKFWIYVKIEPTSKIRKLLNFFWLF